MPRLRHYKWDDMGRAGYAAWKKDRPDSLAFDTETTGLIWFDTPFCVTVAWENQSHFFDLAYTPKNAERVRSIFKHTPVLIGHNLKFDLQKCILIDLIDRVALDPSRVEDTLALGHLLDEQRSNKLKSLAQSVLGLTTNEDARLTKVRRGLKLTKDDGYWPIYVERPEVIVPYAIKDAEFTFELYKRFTRQITEWPELVQLYRDEMEGMLGILDMEARGMGVREEYVTTAIKSYGRRILDTTQEIERLVGKPVRTGKMTAKEAKQFFNPASVPQKIAALAERGYDVPNMQEKTLKGVDDPLAQLFVNLAKDTKIRSTYLLNIRDETRDRVIHPNFKQHGTVTGRMSSGKEEG